MMMNYQPVADENTQLVWYCLVDSNGTMAFENVLASNLRVTQGDSISTLKERLKAQYSYALRGIPACQLTVYRNKESLDKSIEGSKDNEEPALGPSLELTGIANGKNDALMVVVPPKRQKLPQPKSPRERYEVPFSNWFSSDLLPLEPAVTLSKDKLLEMTYNGTVSNVKLEHTMDDQTNIAFKYFEMNFPVLIDAHAGCPEMVFVRPCYETLFDILLKCIAQKIPVLVTGNPGIGLSRFYAYCVLRLSNAMLPKEEEQLRESQRLRLAGKKPRTESQAHDNDERLTEETAMKGKILIIHAGSRFYLFEHGYFWPLPPDAMRRYEDNYDVVRLVDGTSKGLLSSGGNCILFTSPGFKGYGRFEKSEGAEYVMPPWTLEELTIAARGVTDLNEEVVRDRFHRFGGIARFVLSDDPNKFDSQLREAILVVDLFELVNLVTLKDDHVARSYSHNLLQMIPSHEWGPYKGYFLSFASQPITQMIVANMIETKYERLKQFLAHGRYDAFFDVVRGAILEELKSYNVNFWET